MKYNIIDLSDWEIVNRGKGFSNSYWMLNTKTRREGLFKRPKHNDYYDCYYGDHWAEKIVAEIGNKLMFSMPEVDLAIYNNKPGCISYNFLEKDEVLKEGIEILNVDVSKDNRSKYILSNIIDALSEYDLVENFVCLLLFDIFIGQPDRHEENWGIIVSKSKDTRLSPIYDNASSLGRNLLTNKINQMFSDNNYFTNYINNCYSAILLEENKRISQFVMLDYIIDNFNSIYIDFMERISEIKQDNLANIINKVPGFIMTDQQKKLVLKILLARKEIMINK
jgi:hypothetical protein